MGAAIIRGDAGVLLHLRGENMMPDLPRGLAEVHGNAVLALLQLLNEFDSGEDAARVSERFEAQHR